MKQTLLSFNNPQTKLKANICHRKGSYYVTLESEENIKLSTIYMFGCKDSDLFDAFCKAKSVIK